MAGQRPADNQPGYYNSTNGRFNINNVLLMCLLAIIGFLGIQVWTMNDRLARVETTLTFLARQIQQ
jgi:hypothetical protein